MNDDSRPRRGPRARPVAEAPVEVLLARADELARNWAIALIPLRPLNRIGEIPLGDLAREGPAFCAQALRALESDAELDRMSVARAGAARESSPAARRLGALAGASDAGTIVETVEALRSVLWEALIDELREPSARQVAALADRLGYACATILGAALDETPDATVTGRPGPPADTEGFTVAGPGTGPPGPHRSSPGGSRVILVDEHEDAPLPAQPTVRARRGAGNPLPWDVPLAESSQMPEFEVADSRGGRGPAAWIGSIGRQLERFAVDRLPFAVLLVELLGHEHPASSERSAEPFSVTSEVERVLRQEIAELGDRPAGSLTRERPGRYWLVAPGVDGVKARALAERLTTAVRQLRSADGIPLEVAVGTAVCPQDGREAAALAAHADIGLFAARAAGRAATGRPVALVDDPG